ncbi:uncharacterized protein UDID_18567 [Ustilago sp. UG-2017a]|nr:uncharacterized protein UDID_18567 [Ustilago sp. UG-2017a]
MITNHRQPHQVSGARPLTGITSSNSRHTGHSCQHHQYPHSHQTFGVIIKFTTEVLILIMPSYLWTECPQRLVEICNSITTTTDLSEKSFRRATADTLPSNVRMGTATPALSSPRSGTPSTSNTRLTPPSSMLPLAALPEGLVDMPPDSAADLLLSLLTGPPPPPWPNTLCKLPIFDKANLLASVGSLQLRLWSRFLALYPDQAFADQLCGVLFHGAKLDYEGPLCSAARLDISNLPLDDHNVFHLHQEITAHLQEGRLRVVLHPAATGLVCSLLGVIPKPNSDRWRTIYHLSHPRKPRSQLPSVNSGIQPSFIVIHYDNLDAVMDFVCEHPGALLWKADLEDAFRHVIVAESDACLMGIHFDGVYYQECALAFGARSSPFRFNLFAKFLHWLVTFALQSVTAHSPLSHSGVSHYLDDFFGASDLSWDRMGRSRSHMRRSAGIEDRADRGLYSRVHRDL